MKSAAPESLAEHVVRQPSCSWTLITRRVVYLLHHYCFLGLWFPGSLQTETRASNRIAYQMRVTVHQDLPFCARALARISSQQRISSRQRFMRDWSSANKAVRSGRSLIWYKEPLCSDFVRRSPSVVQETAGSCLPIAIEWSILGILGCTIGRSRHLRLSLSPLSLFTFDFPQSKEYVNHGKKYMHSIE